MNGSGIYKLVTEISNDLLFTMTVTVVIVFTIVTKILPMNITHLLGFMISLGVVMFIHDKDKTINSTFNSETDFKLNTILDRVEKSRAITRRAIHSTLGLSPADTNKNKVQELTEKNNSLFLDPNLINVFFNVQDFYLYNADAFEKMVSATDSLLRIHRDLLTGAITFCQENIEIAEEFQKDALNAYHSFIFALPVGQVLDSKFRNNKKRLEILLARHIDDMRAICRRQYGNRASSRSGTKKPLDIYSRVVSTFGPKPLDPSMDLHDFY